MEDLNDFDSFNFRRFDSSIYFYCDDKQRLIGTALTTVVAHIA